MLQLTKRTEYGLIAMVHLAQEARQIGPERVPGGAAEPISAREIAESYGVPKRLLAEVMKDLGRAGLVHSTRGAQGGYMLAHAAEDLSLDRSSRLWRAPVGLLLRDHRLLRRSDQEL